MPESRTPMAYSTPTDGDGDYVSVAPSRDFLVYVSVGDHDEQHAAAVKPEDVLGLAIALTDHLGVRDRRALAHAALDGDNHVVVDAGDPLHVLQLGESTWTMQHPLSCRLGDLFACPVNAAAERLDGPPRPPGRYHVAANESTGDLVVGEAVA